MTDSYVQVSTHSIMHQYNTLVILLSNPHFEINLALIKSFSYSESAYFLLSLVDQASHYILLVHIWLLGPVLCLQLSWWIKSILWKRLKNIVTLDLLADNNYSLITDKFQKDKEDIFPVILSDFRRYFKILIVSPFVPWTVWYMLYRFTVHRRCVRAMTKLLGCFTL